MEYNRDAAVVYAHTWADKRNPKFYNFDSLGGDCTNFISQCLLAGSGGIMDYTRDMGWYYSSINNRAPAWTGVEFLYRFLTASRGKGPRAVEIPMLNAKPGDVVQLSYNGETFAHSLMVVGVSGSEIFIATHTDDADNRMLRSYVYRKCRLLHITEVNG